MSQRTAAYGCAAGRGRPSGGSSLIRVVAEVRRQPLLRLGERPALALGVLGDLVAPETPDDEVLRLRVAEVHARDRGAGLHRHRLGELDARGGLDVEQGP